MKVAITGSNGQLGKELRKIYPTRDTIAIDVDNCDITNRNRTFELLKKTEPDAIIHGAAMTSVDGCEINPDAAFAVNAKGTRNVAEAAKELGAFFVYVSTDYVFNGSCLAPYPEMSGTDPINVYGKSKLAGERAVQETLKHFLIARTAWLYGEGDNFVTKILKAAQTRPELKVVDDQFGSPTYAKDLAVFLSQLINRKSTGIFHCANGGSCSRHIFAHEIVKLAGLTLPVHPVDSSAYRLPAARPRSTALNVSRLQQLGITVRSWKEALRDYMYQMVTT